MSVKPDVDILSEQPAPVSEVRPIPRPGAQIPGGEQYVKPVAIASIRPATVPASAARIVAQDEEPWAACACPVDPYGRYAATHCPTEPEAVGRARRKMRQAFAALDHDAALAEAEKVLRSFPNDGEANLIATRCRETLEEVLVALLGGETTIFDVTAKGMVAQVFKHNSKTAVLFFLIESGFNLGEILETCGERRVEALRIVDFLFREGVIGRR